MANEIIKKGNLFININNSNNKSKIIYSSIFTFNLFNIKYLIVKKKYIKNLFRSKICLVCNNNNYNFNMNFILNYNNIFYIDYIDNNDDDEIQINLYFHYFLSEDLNIIPFQNSKILLICKNIKYIESFRIIIEYSFIFPKEINKYNNLNKIIFIKNLETYNIYYINSENNYNNYYYEINLYQSNIIKKEELSQGFFISLYNYNENIYYLNLILEMKNNNIITKYNFINYDEDIFTKFSKKINDKMYYIGFYPYDSYEYINKNKCINLNIYDKLIIKCKTYSPNIINKNSLCNIHILSFNSLSYSK